jgi:hypothetical protein
VTKTPSMLSFLALSPQVAIRAGPARAHRNL